jgi:HNH endonuclease
LPRSIFPIWFSPAELREKFFARVLVGEGPDDCWEFLGDPYHEYGRFQGNGLRTTANRWSWLIHNGPIPADMKVCHNCPGGDNPRCVRPSHLFLGTSAENTADMVRKGRHWWKAAA